MLLYVTCTVFICYLSFNVNTQLDKITWNAILWIILLFTAVNAVAKSFIQEKEGRNLYYYSLVHPVSIIVSKIIYNAMLMLFLTAIGILVYSIVLGNPVQNMTVFITGVFLGALGFSSTLTMVSSIAAKAGNNGALMAILSFPVIIPVLLVVIKISKNAIDGLEAASSYDELLTLVAINAIIVTVSCFLFPFVWRS